MPSLERLRIIFGSILLVAVLALPQTAAGKGRSTAPMAASGHIEAFQVVVSIEPISWPVFPSPATTIEGALVPPTAVKNAASASEVRTASVSGAPLGRLSYVGAYEGRRVRKGTLLAKISPVQGKVVLGQARANLHLVREVIDLLAYRRSELNEAQDKIEDAWAQLAEAKSKLESERGNMMKEAAAAEASLAAESISLEDQAGATRSQLEAAEAQYRAAKDAYEADPTPENEAAMEGAAAQVKELETALARILAGLDEVQAGLGAMQAQKEQGLGAVAAGEAQIASGEHRLSVQEERLRDAKRKLAFAQDIAGEREDQAGVVVEAVLHLLDKLSIRAPVTGDVLRQSVRDGEPVFANRPLFTIADLKFVRLRLFLTPRQASKVRKNNPVDVTVDSFPGYAFGGRVEEVSSREDFMPTNAETSEVHSSRSVEVTVVVTNAQGVLKPGMPADALIYTETYTGSAR